MAKTAQALWQDYGFLTKEMVKFIEKQDMALFYQLMNQRERLQTSIEMTEDDGFKSSPAGQNLLVEIQKESQFVITYLQSRMSVSIRQHQAIEVYSGAMTGSVRRKTWER